MAGFSKVAELEARKRALAAESDVYREMIRWELRNLQLYGEQLRRKVSWFKSFNPLLMFAAPVARAVVTRKARSLKLRFVARAFLAWRLYKQYAPFVLQFFLRAKSRTNAPLPATPMRKGHVWQ
jgi:hypothetical protein